MDERLWTIQRVLKRGMAGTLFVILLFGAGAAVFSALAAGVSALSSEGPQGPARTAAAQPAQVVPETSPNAVATGGVQSVPFSTSQATGLGVAQTGTTLNPTGFADQLNNALAHMHSPVSEAMDSGGVLLGNRLSHTFGTFLSNLLQFLFVEQADNPTSSQQGAAHG